MVHNGQQFPGAVLSPTHFFCLGGGLRRERQDNCKKNMDEKTNTENSIVLNCQHNLSLGTNIALYVNFSCSTS